VNDIVIEKETTIQSYGEFWGAFVFLKNSIDQNVMGWSNLKLAALTMACFAIEAFANHVGKHLFPSWDTVERGVSPRRKLKMFIEMKEMGIKYEEAPFETVHNLMEWRNKIAHGKTEEKITSHTASVHNYDYLLNQIEQSDWKKYVLNVDIEKIEEDCKELMKAIHLKAFGHLDWFLVGSWQSGSASVTK
jgi:hypothetical protein